MSDPDLLRTFVGIPLVGTAREAALRVQDLARTRFRDDRRIKWERSENLHATLQFLGDTPRSELSDISEALERAAQSHAQFKLDLSTPAIFGGNRPRVFVIETADGSDALRALQADVALELSRVGFEPDRRPYSPHFTIGRVRRGRKRKPLRRSDADKLLEGAGELTVGASLEVKEIVHFESQLSPTGATYSRLATIPLT
jgi:2'-5' RNA ligase